MRFKKDSILMCLCMRTQTHTQQQQQQQAHRRRVSLSGNLLIQSGKRGISSASFRLLIVTFKLLTLKLPTTWWGGRFGS